MAVTPGQVKPAERPMASWPFHLPMLTPELQSVRTVAIVRTTDGGNTWVSQTSGTTNNLNAVSFTDANNGTTVSWYGIILRTIDGGTTWLSQESGTESFLYGVSFADATNGTAVGEAGADTSEQQTAGLTGLRRTSGTTSFLWGVSFADTDNGTAVGSDGTIVRTTNGGNTWVSQTSGTTSNASRSFLCRCEQRDGCG